MGIIPGAIIGGIIGLIIVFINIAAKQRKYKKILKTVTEPIEYSALYYYASAARYNKSSKYFDSYGALYLVGKTAYYKTGENSSPVSFRLDECTVQPEADWKRLKWFSITTPAGEKYYFNSNVKSSSDTNSGETLKGLAALKAKQNIV
jgi:hypothetical protein